MDSTLIILLALVFSAFFSGMEIAYISHNRLRLEIDLSKGKLAARIIKFLSRDPNKYIATMLVGNNIALVIYGLAFAKLLGPWVGKYVHSEFWTLIVQTLISTLIILFFAEFIPKSLFRANPNLTLNLFSPFVLFFYLLFYPITILTIGITNFFIKVILRRPVDKQETKHILGRADLDHFIEQIDEYQKDVEFEQEIKIIKNTLDFKNVKVRECIVPRNELVAVPIDATIEEVREKMAESGLSKILVYENTIDNIVGYIHALSLFKNPKSIKEILVDIPIVPETMNAKKLFDLLLKQNKSIALVVDEYGGTSGIVTIEDILEEIFGEIEDEFDTGDLVEEQISDDEFVFSGRLEIDYINEKYGLNLPTSDEYETIAGLVFDKLERIPEPGDKIKINNIEIEVLEVEPPRIEKVKLRLLDEE